MNVNQDNTNLLDHQSILNGLLARVKRVRNRLVIEALLKTLAFGLIIVPVYVILYSWLDHHYHLTLTLRVTAFIVLLLAIAWLLISWAKVFISHISLSQAANYIESRHTFHQQLVAAIEYHEQKADYPYSKSLTRHMIRQLQAEASDVKFSSTVSRIKPLILLLVVVVAILCFGYLVKSNMKFYKRYTSRLVQPTASIEPLPATNLFNISGDITAEPNERFSLSAGIKGRIPAQGLVMIEKELVTADANDPNSRQGTTYTLLPQTDKDSKDIFQTNLAIEEKGNYRYRFEVGGGVSPWQKLKIANFPKIKSVTVEVTTNSKWIKPFTKDVNDYTLSVFENSYVKLTVHATQPLVDANITLANDAKIKGIVEDDKFEVTFQARDPGEIAFSMTNQEGLKSRSLPSVTVLLKNDQPPKFKLLSPQSDYTCTNVASVPIAFEITDDVALQDARLFVELNTGKVIPVPIDVQKGQKKASVDFTLELEMFDLDISDSLIFYAEANDIDTGLGLGNPTARSDPYFIEIRPYRKLVMQVKPMPPSMQEQGMKMPKPHDKLREILEYNRAFLKKTWSLAHKKKLEKLDKKRLDSITDDVQYTAEHLSMIRDDPGYGFTPEQIQSINSILGDYDDAAKTLTKYQPNKAVPPEKSGYYKVRKLIQDLAVIIPPPGQNKQKEKPDKHKIKEEMHLTRFEKERIEWQLEQIKQKLAELAKEQEELLKEFDHFLKQQEKETLKQQANNRDSWTGKDKFESPQRPPSEQSEQQKQIAKNQKSPVTIEGPQPQTDAQAQEQGRQQNKQKNQQKQNDQNQEKAQEQGKQQGEKQEKQQGREQGKQKGAQKGNGSGKGSANINDMLRMMRAQQNQLQKQLAQLGEQLENMPVPDDPNSGTYRASQTARQDAKKHLQKAFEQMNEFDKGLANQYYEEELSAKDLKNAQKNLAKATDHVNKAKLALAHETANRKEAFAILAEEMAKKMLELAKAYDKSITQDQRREFEQMLIEADELLDAMPDDVLKDQNKRDFLAQALKNNKHHADNQQAKNSNQSGQGDTGKAGTTMTAQNRKTDEGIVDKEVFVNVARVLWSASIEVKKKASALPEKQFSHPVYSEQETEFFERSANYDQHQENK